MAEQIPLEQLTELTEWLLVELGLIKSQVTDVEQESLCSTVKIISSGQTDGVYIDSVGEKKVIHDTSLAVLRKLAG